MFLKAIRFDNYKAFKSAELPLQPLTLLIGPNSSGKTSALSAIRSMAQGPNNGNITVHNLLPIAIAPAPDVTSSLEAVWDGGVVTRFVWQLNQQTKRDTKGDVQGVMRVNWIQRGRIFSLDPVQIGKDVALTKMLEIHENGSGLPAVLTTLQDEWPERFDALNHDLRRWLPEFNRILFDTPSQGNRAIALRTAVGGHKVPTSKLSAGTLLSLALLSICHLPVPPSIIGLEEPDFGLHPRLLRDLKDSLLRLTSPSAFGDERLPVQVIVTTHSPYLVDLFRDELESIVVVQKEGLYSTFSRLSDLPHVAEIVKDAALGEAWYSGILGGVPVGS
jgi:predicted ATPase